MQSHEILQTIGGVAVALTGFSGVVAVLGHRGRGDWSSEEVLQLRTLVEPGLVALFGSLLPGVFQLVSQSEALVWRLSNGALALLGLASAAAFFARSRSASTTTGQRVLAVLAILAIGAHLLFLCSLVACPDRMNDRLRRARVSGSRFWRGLASGAQPRIRFLPLGPLSRQPPAACA
jgi:hypothetical protein